MIKVNDIRIGNMFQTKDGRGVFVSSIAFDPLNITKIKYRYFDEAKTAVPANEEIMSVRLTEELLANCAIPDYSGINFRDLQLPDVEGFWVYQNEEMLANVIYLHHLQNFWYALKHQELKFEVDLAVLVEDSATHQ